VVPVTSFEIPCSLIVLMLDITCSQPLKAPLNKTTTK